MKRPTGRLAAALVVACAVVAAPMTSTGVASARPEQQPHGLLEQLTDSTAGTARVDKIAGSERIRFFGTAPGKAARRPSGVSASSAPELAAKEFVKGYGRLFGIRDAAREVRVGRTVRTAGGRVRTVRLHQLHSGVPVIGGELLIQLEADNDVVAAYGETADPPATTTPSIPAQQAAATAIVKIARDRGVAKSALRASTPTLAVYDPRLLGAPGLPRSALVWRTEVTAVTGEEMRENVFVDAALGAVALNFDELAHADPVRRVCDNKNTPKPTDACTTAVVSPGGYPVTDDVRKAYDFSGSTVDFYKVLGRNGLDGAGGTISSVVRYCPPIPAGEPAADYCPFANAYWNGSHVVYGAAHVADDIVGHELTHGVTDHESSLYYLYQSGAINESLSDVFGELIDQGNGVGTDTPGVKWAIGENLPVRKGSVTGLGGAIRSMQDPTIFGDPDTMTSSRYADAASYSDSWDNGGVHSNSGINNKAAYLISDGAAFLSKPLSAGLGPARTARLYYDASLALGSASDYRALYAVLNQTCANLVTAGNAAFTATHCLEVKQSLDAVQMNALRPSQPSVLAKSCPAGKTATRDRFFDDMENPAAGNWVTASRWDSDQNGTWVTNTSPYGRWFNPQTAHPHGPAVDPTYATSGVRNLWGDDASTNVDSTVARTASLTMTGGSYLQFNHAFAFDHGYYLDSAGVKRVGYFDAGRVEYSTNAGSSWSVVPSEWFTALPYNGTVFSDSSHYDSLFAGTRAFVGATKGYRTSRISLKALATKSVRFRFRTSSDYSIGSHGWFIDDVRVFECQKYDTTLSVAASPTTVTYGGGTTISGRLTYAGSPGGIGSKSIAVYGRALKTPAPGWTKLATVTTSSTGAYTYPARPSVNMEYTTRYVGADIYLSAPSNPAPNVYVAPKVTAALNDTSISRTATAYLSGTVSPAHAGSRVYLQKWISGAWRNVSYTVLPPSSAYRLAAKPGVAGKHYYRAAIAVHSDHAAGVSPTATLVVS